ncbi:MAG: nucleotide-binding protein [Gammaproteobacteria bacterium]|nr:MAG: nucleotide-binding protein [Gammaproteobacteria bacterium]RKZ75734.1 MAG: nucleotide-binding protein [Gammaproteobacteria bacterium]
MNTTVLRIVLDTNILIAIIGRKSPFRWIFDQIIAGELILCVSNEILLEYQEILAIHPFVVKTEIFYQFHLISEDDDDNKFVDCAIAANAVCLVSNDKHFKVLKTIKFPKVNLLTLPEFVQEFKDGLTDY